MSRVARDACRVGRRNEPYTRRLPAFLATQRELELSTELRKKVESCVENTTNIHDQGRQMCP